MYIAKRRRAQPPGKNPKLNKYTSTKGKARVFFSAWLYFFLPCPCACVCRVRRTAPQQHARQRNHHNNPPTFGSGTGLPLGRSRHAGPRSASQGPAGPRRASQDLAGPRSTTKFVDIPPPLPSLSNLTYYLFFISRFAIGKTGTSTTSTSVREGKPVLHY